MDVEDRVEFSDLQQILDAMCQPQELQMAALVRDRGVRRYQLSNSRAVDVGDVLQVQKDILVIGLDQIPQCVTQRAGTFAQGDPAGHIDYGNATYLPSRQLYAH